MRELQMVHEVPLSFTDDQPLHDYNEEGVCWCEPVKDERKGPRGPVTWVIHQDRTS